MQPIKFNNVDLPLPDGPAIVTKSPLLMSSDMLHNAGTSNLPNEYFFVTFFIWMMNKRNLLNRQRLLQSSRFYICRIKNLFVNFRLNIEQFYLYFSPEFLVLFVYYCYFCRQNSIVDFLRL